MMSDEERIEYLEIEFDLLINKIIKDYGSKTPLYDRVLEGVVSYSLLRIEENYSINECISIKNTSYEDMILIRQIIKKRLNI